jgi:hypothetical protein
MMNRDKAYDVGTTQFIYRDSSPYISTLQWPTKSFLVLFWSLGTILIDPETELTNT